MMTEQKKKQELSEEIPPEVQESDTRTFEDNPYQTDNRKPEDIVRLFYVHNVPIVPVISKRGLLIGVLKKEDLVAELSDIERAENLKIDEFITRVARKMTLDDLLDYGKIKEFVVINIFGDILGRWTRLQLFNATEGSPTADKAAEDVDAQREEQVLEWIIYLILEHIPRALYAINENGKTIFYNSYFEDMYAGIKKEEVDTGIVEKLFADPNDNELYSKPGQDTIYFLNRELNLYYEKIPMVSNQKKVGFLIFCDQKGDGAPNDTRQLKGIDLRGGGALADILSGVERQLIVEALKSTGDAAGAAKELQVTKQALTTRIKKYKIDSKNL